MFRAVELPAGLAGRLFLHRMPGRCEAYEDARQEIARRHISRVVCLAPLVEVQTTSPRYAHAIEADWHLAQRPAAGVRRGERVLIHCGAGIGRTGTLATCVLLALGMATDHVRRELAPELRRGPRGAGHGGL